jgi:hypothetical protein
MRSPSVLGHGCLLGSCRLESGSHTSQRASTGGNAFCVCVCVCVCVLGGGEQLSDSLCGTYCARDSALSLSLSLSISVSLFAWKPCLCSSGHPCACAQGPFRPSLPHQGRSSPRQTRCNSPANRTQVAPRAPSRLAAWSLVPVPTIPGSQRPHPAWFPSPSLRLHQGSPFGQTLPSSGATRPAADVLTAVDLQTGQLHTEQSESILRACMGAGECGTHLFVEPPGS